MSKYYAYCMNDQPELNPIFKIIVFLKYTGCLEIVLIV